MHEVWKLSDAGPENYERYQVPSVFGPLADLFLQRVDLREGQRVLDVACGTGAVARRVAPLVGSTGSVVGVDLNANMLEVAAANARKTGANIEWKVGDATSLPYDDKKFDVVLCQQGLQFMPDKATVLSEMKRVLKGGGLVGLCVWRSIEHSPCHSAISAALKAHANEDVARRLGAPFSFGSLDELRSALTAAGFTEIQVSVDEVRRRLLPAEESIPGMLASTPVGPEVANLPQSTRDAIIQQVARDLADYKEDEGFRVPQSTHIATAVKGV